MGLHTMNLAYFTGLPDFTQRKVLIFIYIFGIYHSRIFFWEISNCILLKFNNFKVI